MKFLPGRRRAALRLVCGCARAWDDRAAFEASLLTAAPCVQAALCCCSLRLATGSAPSLAPVRRSLCSCRTAARLSRSVRQATSLLYLAGSLPFGILRLGGSGSGAACRARRTAAPIQGSACSTGQQSSSSRRRAAWRVTRREPRVCIRSRLLSPCGPDDRAP